MLRTLVFFSLITSANASLDDLVNAAQSFAAAIDQQTTTDQSDPAPRVQAAPQRHLQRPPRVTNSTLICPFLLPSVTPSRAEMPTSYAKYVKGSDGDARVLGFAQNHPTSIRARGLIERWAFYFARETVEALNDPWRAI